MGSRATKGTSHEEVPSLPGAVSSLGREANLLLGRLPLVCPLRPEKEGIGLLHGTSEKPEKSKPTKLGRRNREEEKGRWRWFGFRSLGSRQTKHRIGGEYPHDR